MKLLGVKMLRVVTLGGATVEMRKFIPLKGLKRRAAAGSIAKTLFMPLRI
jgi:hypothetical protein